MLSRIGIGLAVIVLLLATSVATGQSRTRLRVSAVVPPMVCLYPGACRAIPDRVTTRVTIDRKEVRYLGSRPSVTEKDGLLYVVF